MVSRWFRALVAFVLQSLLVLASAGAAGLPLGMTLRWLVRNAHVAEVRHVLGELLAHPAGLATGVWVAAQVLLVGYTARALRQGRFELAWRELATPLVIVAFVVFAILVTSGTATFVSNTARVFLSERHAVWTGVAAAVLLAVYLVRIAWAEMPRRPVWRHR